MPEEIAGFQEGADKGVDLKEFIVKYLKYLPWIIIVVGISLFLGYLNLRYSPPIYSSESSMLTNYDNIHSGSNDKFEELFNNGSDQKIQDQIEIIKSRPLIRRVVMALHLQSVYINKGTIRSSILYKNSPLDLDIVKLKDSTEPFSFSVKLLDKDHLALLSGKEIQFGQIFDNEYGSFVINKNMIAFDINAQSASNDFIIQRKTLEQATEEIVSELKVKPVNEFGSKVVGLSIETTIPEMGVDILNQLMKEYETSIVEDKNKTLLNTLKFINDRLDSLSGELKGVEGNLQRFREQNNAIDLESQSKTYIGGVDETGKKLMDQEVKIQLLDYLDHYLRNNGNSYKQVPLNLGIQEPVLLGLISEYNKLQLERENNLLTTTAENPLVHSMDVSLARLRQNILETLVNVRAGYTISRNDLLKNNQKIQFEASAVPGKSKQLVEIGRQQKIKEELFVLLASKRKETAIALASTISNTRVVEPARSSSAPLKPNHRNTYLLYLFAGLLIPIIIIFVIELFNDKVGTRSEIEKATNAPIIGEIGHSDESKAMVTTSNSRRFIAEQFRIVRTNLQYILNKVENPVILVTSSFSGEGKSFISINIGASLALTGKKTVILEFDIRKPKIIKDLGIDKSKGITNYIVGNVRPGDLVVKVEATENLFVIPCGPIPPNPAELLLDTKVAELFEYLKLNFDAIIIDTAPVGLVSDAMVLSAFADATMFIVRHNYTNKKQIKLIDEIYKGKRLPHLGIIINDIDVTGNYGGNYGYGGYGYGYAYGSNYFEDGRRKKNVFKRMLKYFKNRV